MCLIAITFRLNVQNLTWISLQYLQFLTLLFCLWIWAELFLLLFVVRGHFMEIVVSSRRSPRLKMWRSCDLLEACFHGDVESLTWRKTNQWGHMTVRLFSLLTGTQTQGSPDLFLCSHFSWHTLNRVFSRSVFSFVLFVSAADFPRALCSSPLGWAPGKTHSSWTRENFLCLSF